MSIGSLISWLNFPCVEKTATNNTVRGCEPVTDEECGDCWAPFQVVRQRHLPGREGLTMRGPDGRLTWSGKVALFPDQVVAPLSWPTPTAIFDAAHGDLLHDDVPMSFIAMHWAVSSLTPWHVYIRLTKRHNRLRTVLSNPAFEGMVNGWRERLRPGSGPAVYPTPNVIVGVSAGTQKTANLRVPHLVRTPAAVKVVSVEPQSTLVNLTRLETRHGVVNALTGPGRIHWVITGGKAAFGERALTGGMDVAWARATRDQCAEYDVAWHMKQLGTKLAGELGATGKGHDPAEWPEDIRIRQYPEVATHA